MPKEKGQNQKSQKYKKEEWLQLIEGGNFWKIKAYFEKNPSALKLRDKKFKRTPLEWAVHLKSNQDIVKFLKNKPALDFIIKKNDFRSAKKHYFPKSAPVLEAPGKEGDPFCPRKRMRAISDILGHRAKPLQLVVGQKAHADIVHRSEAQQEKYRYSITDIHHQLRVTHNSAETEQGNAITVDISFEILIEDDEENEIRDHVVFPLQIPGHLSSPSITKSGLKTSDASTYAKLKVLYGIGRQVRNMPSGAKHGPTPKYDNSHSDKQFIHHTEQTLAAYLCTPAAAQMLVNRLIATIRAKYPESHGRKVKIYSAVLHMHSDKMPCGPCELTLVGLQNSWQAGAKGFKGFSEHLQDELTKRTKDFYTGKPNAPYKFIFPGFELNNNKKTIQPKKVNSNKKGIRLFTTYTADRVDGQGGGKGHNQPRVAKKPVSSRSPSIIHTRTRQNSSYLWVANFDEDMKGVVAEIKPDTEFRTTILSGSDSTPKTKKSKSNIEKLKKEGAEETGNLMGAFNEAAAGLTRFPESHADIDTPYDHSCLFWSIALAVLVPKINDVAEFNAAYNQLFGGYTCIRYGVMIDTDNPATREQVRQFLTHYNPQAGINEISVLGTLVRRVFRKKLVDYMTDHFGNEEKQYIYQEDYNSWAEYAQDIIRPNTWGGDPEIIAASGMLGINIRVHLGSNHPDIPDPEAETIYIAHVDGGHYHYGLDYGIYQGLVPHEEDADAEEPAYSSGPD